MENISVREWIEKFNNGEFEDADIDTQIEAGWYDWFCKQDMVIKEKEFSLEMIYLYF